MNKALTILSTKLLDEQWVAAAEAAGISIEQKSFIKTTPILNEQLANHVKALASQQLVVVFTSVNAVTAVHSLLNDAQPRWTVHCLSGATLNTVRYLLPGCHISANAPNATELAETIIRAFERSVVHFCGNRRLPTLRMTLDDESIDDHEVIVYETMLTPHTVDSEYDGIMFFSPSAGDSFFSANKPDRNTPLFAIGSTTAIELNEHQHPVYISDAPTQESMIQKITEHFNQINA